MSNRASQFAQPDVVIVGGGPVGLCLANLLSDEGVETLVLEANETIPTELRASSFHPPTLDMLEPLGITEQLLEQGVICPDWQIRQHPTGERAVFDMSVLAGETLHPYRLQCEQWKLSKALLARLEKSGRAEHRFSARVGAVRPHDDRIELDVETENGRETLNTRFLVGCDGARSVVRSSLGIAFEGVTYAETTVLVTTTFPFEEHLEGLSNVSYCWKNQGNFLLLRVPGRWKVSIYADPNQPIEEQTTPDRIEHSLQEIVGHDGCYDVLELRPYRVHMRIVPNYRLGRAFLAGDAAHVNSPAGGMGLNGGLHDAFSLADCLVKVIKHGADERYLDLYDRRRRAIARDEILVQSDRKRAQMTEKDSGRRQSMLSELQAIAADRVKLKAYLMRSSMFDSLRNAASVE